MDAVDPTENMWQKPTGTADSMNDALEKLFFTGSVVAPAIIAAR